MTSATGRGPKVFFYVQHLLGIGHLARASRIAAAMVEDGFTVTMVTGGTPVAGFPGPGVNHVTLPAIVSGDTGFSGIADEHGNPVDDAFKARRTALLLEAFATAKPDIVIIEAFPFGRRQVRFELLPLLDAIARAKPKPKLLTSLRDILQERSKPGRDEETVTLINGHFDHVLVHGDPSFIRIEDTFPLANEIAGKVIYTGLVAAPPPAPPAERFDIVVSAGGGAVGRDLVLGAREAARTLPRLGCWCLIAGPNLPQADYDMLAADLPEGVEVFRFRKDFASLLGGAHLSVSQAGYNTVCDILRGRCRSLLIPFAAGGETEQPTRARHLEAMGLARILAETEVNPQTLADAIRAAHALPAPPPYTLDLDGARRTAAILRELA